MIDTDKIGLNRPLTDTERKALQSARHLAESLRSAPQSRVGALLALRYDTSDDDLAWAKKGLADAVLQQIAGTSPILASELERLDRMTERFGRAIIPFAKALVEDPDSIVRHARERLDGTYQAAEGARMLSGAETVGIHIAELEAQRRWVDRDIGRLEKEFLASETGAYYLPALMALERGTYPEIESVAIAVAAKPVPETVQAKPDLAISTPVAAAGETKEFVAEATATHAKPPLSVPAVVTEPTDAEMSKAAPVVPGRVAVTKAVENDSAKDDVFRGASQVVRVVEAPSEAPILEGSTASPPFGAEPVSYAPRAGNPIRVVPAIPNPVVEPEPAVSTAGQAAMGRVFVAAVPSEPELPGASVLSAVQVIPEKGALIETPREEVGGVQVQRIAAQPHARQHKPLPHRQSRLTTQLAEPATATILTRLTAEPATPLLEPVPAVAAPALVRQDEAIDVVGRVSAHAQPALGKAIGAFAAATVGFLGFTSAGKVAEHKQAKGEPITLIDRAKLLLSGAALATTAFLAGDVATGGKWSAAVAAKAANLRGALSR